MDFKTKLIRDSRLNKITNELVYSVQSRASQNTFNQYNATSTSTTNVSWNIQPPSESTCLDRNLLVEAGIKFTITIPAGGHDSVPIGTNMMMYGYRESFQAFPFNQLITTATATFNNVSVSLNQQDVFPAYLRMLDNEVLQKYQALTPVFMDNYKQFQDSILSNNNPMAAYTNGISEEYTLKRGCHPVSIACVATGTGHNPADNNPIKINNDNNFVFTIQATFVEPLFISPLLFAGLPQNDAALLGLNHFNLVLNLDSSMRRFWSSGLANTQGYGSDGATVVQYNLAMTKSPVCKLYVNYLTLQTTQLVESKNILSYIDVPRYITSTQNVDPIAANDSKVVSLQNIQLQQIPDRFIIFARKPIGDQRIFDSSSFFAIQNVSINFNNCSGILSSCSQYDLWRMSVRNGCKLNWYEWSGKVNAYSAEPTIFSSPISTIGSVLIINPASDLGLPAFLSNGSQGQFSFQANITFANIDGYEYAPEIVVCCMNSGLMETQLGQSSVYTALLTMDKVLACNEEGSAESFGKDEPEVRMLGDGLVNVHSHNKMHHFRLKKVMNELVNHPGVLGGG